MVKLLMLDITVIIPILSFILIFFSILIVYIFWVNKWINEKKIIDNIVINLYFSINNPEFKTECYNFKETLKFSAIFVPAFPNPSFSEAVAIRMSFSTFLMSFSFSGVVWTAISLSSVFNERFFSDLNFRAPLIICTAKSPAASAVLSFSSF